MKKFNMVQTANTVKFFCKKHAPEILTIVSSVATIGAVCMSAKNTRTYDEKKIERKDEIQSKLDSVVVFGEAYWPTIVLTATAIASSVGSTAISKKRQATLLLAYNMLEKKFQKYKNVLADTNPDAYYNQERLYKTTQLENEDVCPGPGEDVYYEPILDTWFTATPWEITEAMSNLNKELIQSGTATVLDLYENLGIVDNLSETNKRIATTRGWCCLDEFRSGMKQTDWIDYSLPIEEDACYDEPDEKPLEYTVLNILQWPESFF